jgi:uncharacterized membrane protein (DUF373 family)
MDSSHFDGELWARAAFARRFGEAEHVLYIIVGSALAIAAFVLFGNVVYRFLHDVAIEDRPLTQSLLDGVEGLLLVFIFAELLHTVRVVIAHDELRTEPFLVVGIVAAIRRFIVASAEATNAIGTSNFRDQMLELAILVAAVVALSFAIWLMRTRPHELA